MSVNGQGPVVQPAKTVTLPSTRATLAWDRATDALVAAAEADEAKCKAEYDSARDRYQAARQNANMIRRSLPALRQKGATSRQPGGSGVMNVTLRPVIPANVAIFLSSTLAGEIASASFAAEQRLTDREQAAESAATALQWLETELDRHVVICRACEFVACPTISSLRDQRHRALKRYRRSLRQLRGGR